MIENSAHHKEFVENSYTFASDIASPPARVPLSGIHSAYYRSKLFNIDTHINPLVSAAAPLLALASAFKNASVFPDIHQLYQDLCHEIRAFENKAQSHNYRSHIILAARYALCALLDEIISDTSWNNKNLWKTHNLLTTFQQEMWGGERFFIILERCSEDPSIHIDLLELMYICLSMGFEGKYKQMERGYQHLTETIDSVYELIQQQRGEFSQKLFLQTITNEQTKLTKWSPSIWLTIIATPLLLLFIYCGLNYLLNARTSYLFNELNQFKKIHVHFFQSKSYATNFNRFH